MLNQKASTDWVDLSRLCPEITPHIIVNEQVVRGTVWFILQNEATGEHARFNRTSHAIISRLDGEHSLELILESVNKLPYAQCDETTLIQLMIKLQRLGALVGFDFVDSESMRERYVSEQNQSRYKRWLNPLAVKISLLDPDALLDRAVPKLHRLFDTFTAWLWGFVLALALFAVLKNWGDITHEFTTRTLRLETLWWFALLYPILKFFHEFAHAVCVKHWGGQVRDVGISFLLLIPVPYVDATDVYATHTRRQRLLLTGAGMGVELFIASVAVLLWFWVGAGYLKDALFSIFILGGLTTLLFNANPLLKFDGYYLLQDALDIPNLAARSSQWLQYAFKRQVLGMKEVEKPFASPRESKWLMLYAIAVSLYRPFLTLMIIIFLWRTYPLLGIILAAFALVNTWFLPLFKALRWMILSPELDQQRSRSLALVFCSLCALTALLLIPLPSSTRVQGVVAASEQGEVFSQTDGFIESVHIAPGAHVKKGTALITLKNPNLSRDLQQIQSQLTALNADQVASIKRDSDDKSKDHATTEAEKERLLNRQQELIKHMDAKVVKAAQDGIFAPVSQDLLPGAYVKHGERIGFVVTGNAWTVRTLVPETRAERLRSGISGAYVRLVESLDVALPATVVKETPAVTRKLLSSALSQHGGGYIVTDPYDTTHTQALNNLFEIELALPESTVAAGLGQRALVQLKHPPEALLRRFWRATRSVWMTRDHV